MDLKRVFPDSLTLEMDPDDATEQKLWEISRLCVRLWNATLSRQQQTGQAETHNEDSLTEILAQDPELKRPARSVLKRVLWSIDEANAQYQQAQQDLADGKRVGLPMAPHEQNPDVFFPLHFTSEYVRLKTDTNVLELSHDGAWFPVEQSPDGASFPVQLPQGDFHKIEAVLIMHQPDRQHFAFEFNPILQDIKN